MATSWRCGRRSTARPTPVTATVEVQGAGEPPVEATLESTAGPATLVVPLDEQ